MQENLKTSLKNYNNKGYNTNASGLKRLIWYFVNIIFFINPLFPISSLKVLLLRFFGATVGNGVVIKPSVNIKYPWMLKVGSYVWIGENVWIDNLTEIYIHDNVVLSQGSMLLTGNHDYKIESFDLIVAPIILEDGVWIGAKALVCPGVICKNHSVLAAGSVAVKNLEEYVIYQGNPASPKRIRTIN